MGCSPWWGHKESDTTERLTLLYQAQGATAFPGNFHGWRRRGLTSAGNHPYFCAFRGNLPKEASPALRGLSS